MNCFSFGDPDNDSNRRDSKGDSIASWKSQFIYIIFLYLLYENHLVFWLQSWQHNMLLPRDVNCNLNFSRCREKRKHSTKGKRKVLVVYVVPLMAIQFIFSQDCLFSTKRFFQLQDKIVLRISTLTTSNKSFFSPIHFVWVQLEPIATLSLKAVTFARVIPSCLLDKTLEFIYAGPLIKRWLITWWMILSQDWSSFICLGL